MIVFNLKDDTDLQKVAGFFLTYNGNGNLKSNEIRGHFGGKP